MILCCRLFMPKSDATRNVWCAFENYVVMWYMLYISVCVSLLPVFWRIKVFINYAQDNQAEAVVAMPGIWKNPILLTTRSLWCMFISKKYIATTSVINCFGAQQENAVHRTQLAQTVYIR